MNRKQRRSMQKKSGLSANQVKAVESLMSGTPLKVDTLPEGQQVRLNLEKIHANPDFERMMPRYKKFVNESYDKVYTVEHDARFGHDSSLVCLAEDESEVK